MFTPATLALFVIVWPGHDIQPKQVDSTECARAVSAVQMAINISEKQYAMQSDVSAYCVPFNTAADEAVFALLARPEPPPTSKPIPVSPSPNH